MITWMRTPGPELIAMILSPRVVKIGDDQNSTKEVWQATVHRVSLHGKDL
jgi:hypothetical protein